MPSVETGYTNEIEYALDEYGLPNINYSYILAEDLEFLLGFYLLRLIDAHFGGWANMSGIESTDEIYYLFGDMFLIKNKPEGLLNRIQNIQ